MSPFFIYIILSSLKLFSSLRSKASTYSLCLIILAFEVDLSYCLSLSAYSFSWYCVSCHAEWPLENICANNVRPETSRKILHLLWLLLGSTRSVSLLSLRAWVFRPPKHLTLMKYSIWFTSLLVSSEKSLERIKDFKMVRTYL